MGGGEGVVRIGLHDGAVEDLGVGGLGGRGYRMKMWGKKSEGGEEGRKERYNERGGENWRDAVSEEI